MSNWLPNMDCGQLDDGYLEEEQVSFLANQSFSEHSDAPRRRGLCRPCQSYWSNVLPWVASTITSLCLSLYLWCLLLQVQSQIVFRTDLPALQSLVDYEERRFTRELTYDPLSKRVIRTPTDAEPDYFGHPSTSPDIDVAWDNLMRGKQLI